MNKIVSYDLDGVLSIKGNFGLNPGNNDIIVTGRSYEEMAETLYYLRAVRKINNIVYFNKVKFEEKTRLSSAEHKVRILKNYKGEIDFHIEDDPIQKKHIEENLPWIKVILIQHDLVTKENCRRDMNGNEIVIIK